LHPARAINFLVGVRGKNETMAIGGPWSPSLDGPDPEADPSVLVRTAIRTAKALAGVDLSGCTQWHKFLEVHYRRQETHSKPARTETTVIFLPDIWSAMPSAGEFTDLEKEYAEALHLKLNPELAKAKEEAAAAAAAEEQKDVKPVVDEAKAEKQVGEAMETEESNSTAETEASKEGVEDDPEAEGRKPTPWKELDVKSMKVNELREELEARGLNSKGLKSQLVGRLQKSLKEEQEASDKAEAEPEKAGEEAVEDGKEQEAKAVEETPAADEEKKEEEEEKKADEMEVVAIDEVKKDEDGFVVPAPIDEKQKAALTTAYKFPTSPCIPVHPNPKAKSGKFDCSVMSLSVLLDYRSDDNKEGTFEVSLFAELFNEMLLRDAGFKLYRALMDAPTPQKRKEEDKEDKEKAKEDQGEATKSTVTEEEKAKPPPAKMKTVTQNKELLMACAFFDLGHSGYFEMKDLEDILTTLDLNLSRAQIKKLVNKVKDI